MAQLDVRPAEFSELHEWMQEDCELFALLDACGEAEVTTQVFRLGKRAVSLYRGRAEQDLFAIAPYIAEVDSELIASITCDLAAKPWGYFVTAPKGIDLTDMRKHFRQFLIVKGPDEQELYFRFYDPRVLKTFLMSSSKEELNTFYGSANRLAVIEGERLTVYSKLSSGHER